MLTIYIVNTGTVRRQHVSHLTLLIPSFKFCTNYRNRGTAYPFSKLPQVVLICKAINSWLPGPIVHTRTLVTYRETVTNSESKRFVYYFNTDLRIITYITHYYNYYIHALWWRALKYSEMWRVDLGWTPGAHQAALSLPSSAGQGEEKTRRKKTLVGQEKGSSIKQKQRPHTEAKENKRLILYFPSAGDVQPPPGKQGFSTHSGCSGRQASY